MEPIDRKKTKLIREKGRLDMRLIENQWKKQGKNIIREDELLNRQNYGK